MVWLWSNSKSVNFIQKILKKVRIQKISELFGKDARDRTAIPVHAIQVLSQTYRSHTPHECHEGIFARGNEKGKNLREDNQWMFCRRMGNLDRIIEHPN